MFFYLLIIYYTQLNERQIEKIDIIELTADIIFLNYERKSAKVEGCIDNESRWTEEDTAEINLIQHAGGILNLLFVASPSKAV